MDPTVRGQIQTESMQVGSAMQHLGSLLLELGRTILTLRMGQSPVSSCSFFLLSGFESISLATVCICIAG